MGQREAKPFMVTEEQIENYQFTKKQIAAYNSLKKAQERCVKSGLSLFGKQWSLIAYPTKFYKNDMMAQSSENGANSYSILCPCLSGVSLSDSGADDTEYIKDKYIK